MKKIFLVILLFVWGCQPKEKVLTLEELRKEIDLQRRNTLSLRIDYLGDEGSYSYFLLQKRGSPKRLFKTIIDKQFSSRYKRNGVSKPCTPLLEEMGLAIEKGQLR